MQNKYGYLMFHTLVHNGVGTLNANKDGTPKSVLIGGDERNRISSQKNRHEMREAIRGFGYDLSTQTRELLPIIIGLATRESKKGEEEKDKSDTELFCTAILSKLLKHGKVKDGKGKKKGKKNSDDNVEEGSEDAEDEKKIEVCRFTKKEVDTIKDYASRWGKGEEINIKSVLFDSPDNKVDEIDLFLFGRMRPTKISGSLRVANGIGIGRKVVEKDFFSASDDLLEKNSERGDNGHLGDHYLSSFTSYHYTVLNLNMVMEYYSNDVNCANKLIEDYFKLVLEHAPKSNSVGSPNQGTTVYIMAEKAKDDCSLEIAVQNPIETPEECISNLRNYKKSLEAMHNTSKPAAELCGIPGVQGCVSYKDFLNFIKI